jgi:hypothetical protein
LAGNICFFSLKKRAFTNQHNFFTIKVQDNRGITHKNVLTGKKGRFSGVLAGKRGFWAGKKPFYFAFLHVFVVFFVCKPLSIRNYRRIALSKKNRA